MFRSIKKIHFIGIGGIGMSGIAEILVNKGFTISGSDIAESENTRYLENLGIKIYIGHSGRNIGEAEAVVYSSAVNPSENPETLEARRLKIPVIRRAEMLAEVSRLNYSIAVAGTHGKTTATSMLGLILIKANYDPTIIVGGRLKDFGGTNARMGEGNWTLVEADEYDRSFLQLFPTVAVINNVEAEHLDIYSDFDDIKNTFIEFANKVPFYGFIAVCLDESASRDIIPLLNKKVVTYGLDSEADYYVRNIKQILNTCKFEVCSGRETLGEIKLNIPGEHNIKNALACIATARSLDISFETIKEGLEQFSGVYRRFDIRGSYNGATIIDDYAHHPTEVKAALKATREAFTAGKVYAVFQPHTFSRTQNLYKDFAESFENADVTILTDIYPSREKPINGVTSQLIIDSAAENGKELLHLSNFDDIVDFAKNNLSEGDILITLGAGNVCNIAYKLVEMGK